MAQREGSVYLWLFVSSFVLFVAMLVLFFLENAQKTALEDLLRKAQSDIAREKQSAERNNLELSALRDLVGGQKAKEAWPGDEFYRQKKQEAEDFINAMYKNLEGKAPKSLTDMVDAFADYKNIITKILETRQRAEERQKRAEEDKVEIDKANKKEVEQKDQLVNGLRTQVSDTESKYERKVSDLTKDNERLQKELAAIKDQSASAEIEASRKLQYCENVKNSLLARLDQLLEEQRKTKTIEDVDPDGQVLQVAGASHIGWVNIGRRQHLRPGLDFQVFQNIKGGKRQYKGRIQIRRVEDAISEFQITSVSDELNPITQGDFVTSPFYDPKAVPIFVIAGEGLESKDVTEESLRAKIKGYGAEIREKVDLKTSFLIALKNYDKSPLYKEAREFGVPVLREHDILAFMGF